MTEFSPSEQSTFSSDIGDGSVLIEKANNFLLYRKFQECLDVCNRGLALATLELENSVSAETAESLCVVAIQAYAELNRWQEVLPFITQIYSGIEDCPPKVAQLCLLLHSHVAEYPTCSAISHIWLRNPNNYANSKYEELCTLYICKVLVPTNKWDEIPKFLDSCPGLSDLQRQKISKQTHKLKQVMEQESSEEIEELDAHDGAETSTACTSASERSLQESSGKNSAYPMIVYMKKMKLWVVKNVPAWAWDFGKNLCLLSLLVYIVVTRTHFSMISRQKLWNIWASLVLLWKRMFAPFHRM